MFYSREEVQRVKERFPSGTRVECVHINDPFAPVYPGERGTVENVDCVGTIHISWDSGRHFGAALGVDSVRAIPGEAWCGK